MYLLKDIIWPADIQDIWKHYLSIDNTNKNPDIEITIVL